MGVSLCGFDPEMASPTFNPKPDKIRSLYIHVPFCRHRCGYCNFTLVADRDDLIERYLEALATEIGWLSYRPVISTLFLGGGTPSHLSPDQIRRLFDILDNGFIYASDPEISVECNPNDLNAARADALRECRVNRISFGVQSFNPDKLSVLERDHTPADILTAVDYSRQITDNVSLDMIFAVPGESVDHWRSDLEAALGLSPSHLSTYELTIEKGTQFWNRRQRGCLEVPDEDFRAELFEIAISEASAHGLQHYEISSFAKPQARCQHNLSYWNGNDYLAFGPGAARFVDGVRETNHRSTTAWLKLVESGKSPVTERQILSLREIAVDRLVFGLRQIDGISIRGFRAATEIDPIRLMGNAADLLFKESLIELDGDRCRLTSRGIMLYDGVAAEIIAAAYP